jgi:hypothetical protein
MLTILSQFYASDIEESECCIELSVIALSATCVDRDYGKLCFSPEILQKKAKELIGKPVLLDHEWRVDKIVGVVVDAHYNEEKKAIVARLRIPKEGHEKLIALIKLSPSPIKDVSVGAMVKTKKDGDNYTVQDIEFKEISLVFEGADKNAKRIAASATKTELGVQNWWDDPELRTKAPRDYFLDPSSRRYPYKTWEGEISCERLKAALSLSALHGHRQIYERAKALYEKHCQGG